MPTRTKNGTPRVVLAPQRLADGRPSRARSASEARPSRVVEVDGAVSGHAVALALAIAAFRSAPSAEVNAARKRLTRRRAAARADLGRDRARALEAHVALLRLDAAAIAKAKGGTRTRLAEALGRGVSLAEAHHLRSAGAAIFAARSARFAAFADMLLDASVADLDPERLKLAAALASAGRLELLAGLEAERRSRDAREADAAPVGTLAEILAAEEDRRRAVPAPSHEPASTDEGHEAHPMTNGAPQAPGDDR